MDDEEIRMLKNAYREARLGGWREYRNLLRCIEHVTKIPDKEKQGIENLIAMRRAEGGGPDLEAEMRFFPSEVYDNLHLSDGAKTDREKYEEEQKK